MNKLIPALKVGAVGCLSIGAALSLSAPPVQAVELTFSFTAFVTDGPFAGQSGTGTITYDDDFLDVLGDGLLTPEDDFGDFNGLVALTFSFLGQNYTASDDFDFPGFPELTFFDGDPVFLDFLVEDGFPTDIQEPSILAFRIQSELIPTGVDEFETVLAVQTALVPEPTAGLGLLALGALGTALRRRA